MLPVRYWRTLSASFINLVVLTSVPPQPRTSPHLTERNPKSKRTDWRSGFIGVSRPHLENTGIGQYLPSSPKTWQRFLLKPRLKPFLSAPWRNTGERTASEGTHTHTHTISAWRCSILQAKPESWVNTHPEWTCSYRQASSGRWGAQPGWPRTWRLRRRGRGCGTWPECPGVCSTDKE